jgi:hypothetical protein
MILWYDGLGVTPKFDTVFVTRGSVLRGKYINYIYKSIYWSCTDQLLLCSIANLMTWINWENSNIVSRTFK